MVEVYYKLIKLGKKTINDVPDVIRADVQKLLDENTDKNNTEIIS